MHLIYTVKPGDDNEELRYSLRSAEAYMNPDKITIVGDAPSWLIDVEVIEGNPTENPDWNTAANIVAACQDYPGEFVFMNDDFIAMKPVEPLPLWFGKPLLVAAGEMKDPRSAERVGWFKSTDRYLRGMTFANPMSYELHVPLPVVGADMLRILNTVWASPRWEKHPGLWRTLYGHFAPAIGNQDHEYRRDVKIHTARSLDPDADFISTDEKTWHTLIPILKEKFPNPSTWEASS